jgi:hypothetical protein
MSTPTITVSCTLNDLSGAGIQENSFVRFRLRNLSGWVPRVELNSVIVPLIYDALPNSSGQVSTTIIPNNVITPSTTFYSVDFYINGELRSSGNYLLNQPGPVDLDTASQLNNPPVPPGYQLVLQANGSDISNQNLQNLYSSDGTVTITDEGDGFLNFHAGNRFASFNFTIDGGGSVPGTGAKGQVTVPANCTVTGWVLTADQSGSAVVDVLASSYASFPTTASIAGSDKPTLSSAQKNENLAVSVWTAALTAGEQLQINLNSASTVTRINLAILVTIA